MTRWNKNFATIALMRLNKRQETDEHVMATVPQIRPANPKNAFEPKKPAALLALLSLAKRTAVMECFNNNGLYKRKGCWWGAPDGRHISGVTVAELSRDGIVSGSPTCFGTTDRARRMGCADANRGRKRRSSPGIIAAPLPDAPPPGLRYSSAGFPAIIDVCCRSRAIFVAFASVRFLSSNSTVRLSRAIRVS